MYNRLLFTLATAACLTGVYAGYAVMMRPWVVIPEMPAIAEPAQQMETHRPAENVRVAEAYLKNYHWVAQSKYMLRSGPDEGRAFIYTRKWKHKEDDSRVLIFSPFAMVWRQKDKEGRESAVSLHSESAQLKFQFGFEQFNSNPGRVVGAVLDGEVRIAGPDGLEIEGKQFVFDESAPSLVSTNPVRFEYANHRGRGQSLNMKLIPAEGPPGQDRPHVFGIRTIRLGSGRDPETQKFEHVQLDVRMPQQGQQQLAQIRCSGDLEYDVGSNTAHFTQAVRAHQRTSGAGYDQLECDDLWLKFDPVRAIARPDDAVAQNKEQGESPAFQQLETNLEFKRLIARGQTVSIVSTENNLHATMKCLTYDLAEHRLQLIDASKVTVLQQGYKVAMEFDPKHQTPGVVPEIEARMLSDNSLNEVFCRGVGLLEMTRPNARDRQYVVSWARQLLIHKSSDQVKGLDLIQLEQQATFRQPSQGTALGADLIRLWMVPVTVGLPSGNRNSVTPHPGPELQPRQLIAERNVALFSPQLEANTSELTVEFLEPTGTPRVIGQHSRSSLELVTFEEPVEPANQARPARTQPGPRRTGTGRVSPAGFAADQQKNSLWPPISISPGGDDTVGPAHVQPQPKPVAQSPRVTADRINVRMQRIAGKAEPEMVEVDTTGHVKIVQHRGKGEPPMTAEGERLQLQNRGKDREIVHLFGNPAHLRDRGIHVEGREVQLNRETNRVRVQGNGLLQLPVPPGTGLESFGQATNDPDLDVKWGESMEFDGQVAKFVGKVELELGWSRMRCELMDVTLSSRISFTEPNSRQQPELAKIHCREEVSFENSEYEGSKQIQVQRGRVAEFTLDRLRSKTFAQGPGQMQVWQRGSTGHQTGNSRGVVQGANRPIGTVSSDWDYTQVDFKGSMEGKITQQVSTFYDSVQIVHGPVSLPNMTIDPDHLPPDAGSMRCEKTLEFSQGPKSPVHPKGYQQLVGKGNAQIEGKGFYANADEISFDGSKGLYMLRAHGNQSAMIAQDDHGKRREASGRRIEFIPATQKVKVDQATGASGGP
ncbi:MAG: hypothetical protein JSS49_11135 [Planctomycetes bacterium]|nr:hypothetical protein [Planctomycetota bacterium]